MRPPLGEFIRSLIMLVGTALLISLAGVLNAPFSHAATGMACDIQHGPCSSTADGISIIFDVQPKPVVAMSESVFIVTLSKSGTPVTDATIQINLSMPGMFMGTNQPVLKHVKNGRYEGKGIITRCASGKKTWQADVVIQYAGTTTVSGFIFEVK